MRTKVRNKTKKTEYCMKISLDYDPLTQKNEKDMRGKKHVPQGNVGDKDNNAANAEKDKLDLDEDNMKQCSIPDDHGYMTGVLSNPSTMRKDIKRRKCRISKGSLTI